MIGRARCGRTMTAALAITVLAASESAHAGWMPAADLAPAVVGRTVGEPSVAVARDGTAYVAFVHFDGASARAAVVMRSPGGGFGAPRDLSPAGLDASNPVVAVDRQGSATLAWLRGGAIETRLRPAGGDWLEAATVPPPAAATGTAFNGPALAAGDNGGAVVGWVQGDAPSTARVVAAVRRPGTTAFATGLFASPQAGNVICGAPRVAIDTGGDVAVVWTRNPALMGGQYHVESNVKAAEATSSRARSRARLATVTPTAPATSR